MTQMTLRVFTGGRWQNVSRTGGNAVISPQLSFHASNVPPALQYSLNNIILTSILSWARCTKYHVLDIQVYLVLLYFALLHFSNVALKKKKKLKASPSTSKGITICFIVVFYYSGVELNQ